MIFNNRKIIKLCITKQNLTNNKKTMFIKINKI